MRSSVVFLLGLFGYLNFPWKCNNVQREGYQEPSIVISKTLEQPPMVPFQEKVPKTCSLKELPTWTRLRHPSLCWMSWATELNGNQSIHGNDQSEQNILKDNLRTNLMERTSGSKTLQEPVPHENEDINICPMDPSLSICLRVPLRRMYSVKEFDGKPSMYLDDRSEQNMLKDNLLPNLMERTSGGKPSQEPVLHENEDVNTCPRDPSLWTRPRGPPRRQKSPVKEYNGKPSMNLVDRSEQIMLKDKLLPNLLDRTSGTKTSQVPHESEVPNIFLLNSLMKKPPRRTPSTLKFPTTELSRNGNGNLEKGSAPDCLECKESDVDMVHLEHEEKVVVVVVDPFLEILFLVLMASLASLFMMNSPKRLFRIFTSPKRNHRKGKKGWRHWKWRNRWKTNKMHVP